jgi:hypothetical protein
LLRFPEFGIEAEKVRLAEEHIGFWRHSRRQQFRSW